MNRSDSEFQNEVANSNEHLDKAQGQLRLTSLEAAFARDAMRKQAVDHEREAADRKRGERQDRANRAMIKLEQLAKSLARPKTSHKYTSINEAALCKFVLLYRRNGKEWKEVKQLASSRFRWLKKLKGEKLAKLWKRVQNTTLQTLSREERRKRDKKRDINF